MNKEEMKELTVRFNNLWNEDDDESYEIIIFKMPSDIDIDIRKETTILDHCHDIFDCYDIEDKEELAEAMHDYGVTEKEMEIANDVLEGGECGVTASRIAEFIEKKYPSVTWEVYTFSCDLEIDIY